MPYVGMTTNEHPSPPADLVYTGQTWIAEAIAQQEEHLRRSRSCSGSPTRTDPVVGMSHSWDRYSPAPGHETYQACWRCRVTRTDEDWQRKVAPRPAETPEPR